MYRCIIAVGWTDIQYKFQDAFHWILCLYFSLVMVARHGHSAPLGMPPWAPPPTLPPWAQCPLGMPSWGSDPLG